MTVKSAYQIDHRQIDEMDLTISITMKVSEWRVYRKAQPYTWPSCDVSRTIDGALKDVELASCKRHSDHEQ